MSFQDECEGNPKIGYTRESGMRRFVISAPLFLRILSDFQRHEKKKGQT